MAGGTGHVARAYAELARCAIVLDLTAEMLEVGKREVDAAGLRNVLFQLGEASAMPFLSGSFDLVISRFAVHHFPDPAISSDCGIPPTPRPSPPSNLVRQCARPDWRSSTSWSAISRSGWSVGLSQTQPSEDVASRLRADLEAEISGGAATGMRAHLEADELYFTQRWAIGVGQPPADGSH